MKTTELSPSQHAEMALVGTLAMDAPSCQKVFGMLSPCMFEIDMLRSIYEAMLLLYRKGQRIDIITLIGSIGGNSAEVKRVIERCAEIAPSISGAVMYAGIVADAWRRREMQTSLLAAIDECVATNGSADEVVNIMRSVIAAQEELSALGNEVKGGAFTECVERFKLFFGKKNPSPSCGWENLDCNNYLTPGRVTVLAARPGSGKTDFALAWAVKLSVNVPVMFFSFEMGENELFCRIASSITRIDGERIQSGKLTQDESGRMNHLLDLLKSQSKLIIPDIDKIRNNGLEFIESCIRTVHPPVVFIDYVNLISTGMKYAKEVDQLRVVTGELKKIAKRHGVAIVELAQLNREVDKRRGGQNNTSMADLRGSGTIEQDADAILFINPEEHPEKMQGNMFCEVTLKCQKNRHGPKRTMKFDWFPQHSKYIPIDAKFAQPAAKDNADDDSKVEQTTM